MFVGLLEETMTMFDIIRRADGVVDTRDDDEGPADRDQDPIGGQGTCSVSVPSYEGVV